MTILILSKLTSLFLPRYKSQKVTPLEPSNYEIESYIWYQISRHWDHRQEVVKNLPYLVFIESQIFSCKGGTENQPELFIIKTNLLYLSNDLPSYKLRGAAYKLEAVPNWRWQWSRRRPLGYNWICNDDWVLLFSLLQLWLRWIFSELESDIKPKWAGVTEFH